MFIINLTYKVPLEKVDHYLEAHIEYLKVQYAAGNFIASGRKVPRTGGVILSNLKDKSTLQEVLNQDPFSINDLAEYDVIEFVPSMTSEAFEILKS